MNGGLAYHAAIHQKLNLGIAGSSVRGEHTVIHSAQSGIPNSVVRNLRCGTGRANAGGGKLDGGARGHIAVFSGKHRTLEHIGRSCSRNNDQGGADSSLRTVGWAVDDGYLIFALLSGSEGGRAAAIQVDGRYTASLQHDLSQFMHCATAREGLLAAVQRHQDDLAVSSDTYAGTAVAVCVVAAAGVGSYILAVKYQNLTAAYSFYNSRFGVIGIPIRGTVADNGGSVLTNGEEGAVIGCVYHCSFHNKGTAGSAGGHVVEVAVNTGYHGIVGVIVRCGGIGSVALLGSCHLIGQLGHTKGGALVISIVRINRNIAAVDICRCHIVHHLLAIFGISINDVLGNTRGNGRLGAGEYLMGLRHEAAVRSYLCNCRSILSACSLCAVSLCSKSGGRCKAHQHRQRQKHCQHAPDLNTLHF